MKVERHQREELERIPKKELIDYVMKLEEQITRDSLNSSKPPSSDKAGAREKRKKKDRSLRVSSGRKPGGQKGHPGATLQAAGEPDSEIPLKAEHCEFCHEQLSDKDLTGECISRQVFDLPEPPRLECTQYNASGYCCSKCGCIGHAEFPRGVSAPVQYGSRMGAWLIYMKDELLLPYNRIETFFKDLLDVPVSPATIDLARERLYQNLESWEEKLIRKLIGEDVLGADESGLRVKKELYWLHVASTETLTFFGVHKRRGKEAMDELGILPHYRGWMIHDCLAAYNLYEECRHGLCNQHHLRDLKAVNELKGQCWAPKMAELLQAMLHRRHEHEGKGSRPDDAEIQKRRREYDGIVKHGEEENPLPPRPDPPPKGRKKRGRPKKGKARNLVERFRDKASSILAFFEDFRVPFTNNQPEQDIRMVKVQQKVSGCFRSEKGAKRFARIRSYNSTMRKLKRNVFEAIKVAYEGNPHELPKS